jgi:hypothetical protein
MKFAFIFGNQYDASTAFLSLRDRRRRGNLSLPQLSVETSVQFTIYFESRPMHLSP